MRPIDADALIKKICGNECGSVCDEECENAACNFYDYIMDAPTIELEVRHGRWIQHKITASSICSECRRVFADETLFCPNCGARMDGSDDNG